MTYVISDIHGRLEMYFYEVLKSSDKETVIRKFMAMFGDVSKDMNPTERACGEAFDALCAMSPEISDKYTIFIEKSKLISGEITDNVFFLDDVQPCSLVDNPWAETLGYAVDEKCLANYSCDDIAALVLWEMTWFGYDEESIQNKVTDMLSEE
ncbi:MAG: hypothetical protein NC299_14715 [Lachnospiraceae bacterium]|nr:hypothetical protein [Ruminococcus sp.]MCM1276589.1 hypothetical protein [Lachnospiraceae bacterium]